MNDTARSKLLAALAAGGAGMLGVDAAAMIDAYTHEIAQNLRTDTRNGYRPNTTRYQHYMEAADHIDPEKP